MKQNCSEPHKSGIGCTNCCHEPWKCWSCKALWSNEWKSFQTLEGKKQEQNTIHISVVCCSKQWHAAVNFLWHPSGILKNVEKHTRDSLVLSKTLYSNSGQFFHLLKYSHCHKGWCCSFVFFKIYIFSLQSEGHWKNPYVRWSSWTVFLRRCVHGRANGLFFTNDLEIRYQETSLCTQPTWKIYLVRLWGWLEKLTDFLGHKDTKQNTQLNTSMPMQTIWKPFPGSGWFFDQRTLKLCLV